MSGPAFVLRDYSGGVPTGVQLSANMGATDLAFTIASTVGWTNAAGEALGTNGPFTVVGDLGAASVEKILCSSVNLTSGLVTVYSSGGFSGRGYDQTTAQAHVVGGSSTGFQPCWSAVEAAEANKAVFELLGGGNLPGSVGGRCYAASGSTVSGTNLVTLTNAGTLKGGVTFQTTGGNTGLVVPTTGTYSIGGQVKVTNAAANNISAFIAKNTGATLLAYGNQAPVDAAPSFQASVVADPWCELEAGDVVNLGYVATNIVPFQIDANNSSNYLSIALMAAG